MMGDEVCLTKRSSQHSMLIVECDEAVGIHPDRTVHEAGHTSQDSICDEADCAYSSKGKSSTSKTLTTWKAHDFVPEERCNYATRSADYQHCVLDPFCPRRNRHRHRMDVHALGCLDFGVPNVARSLPKFEGGSHGF